MTPLSPDQRDMAISNLIQQTRAGNRAALRDLVHLVRSSQIHPDTQVAAALADVLFSSRSTSDQIALVESLRGHWVYPEVERELTARKIGTVVSAARAGDLSAVRDLVRLAGSPPALTDRRIVDTLADFFLADGTGKDLKTLIWSLRDRRVYRWEWEEEVDSYRTEQYGDQVGEVYEGTYTVTRTKDYTFLEYLKTNRYNEIAGLIAREGR